MADRESGSRIIEFLLTEFPGVYEDQESVRQAMAEYREFDQKLTYVVAKQTVLEPEDFDFATFMGLGAWTWLTERIAADLQRQRLFDDYRGQAPEIFVQEADPEKNPIGQLLQEFPEMSSDKAEFRRLLMDQRDFEGRVRFLTIKASIESVLIQRGLEEQAVRPDLGFVGLAPRPYTVKHSETSDLLRTISSQLAIDFLGLTHRLCHLSILHVLFLTEMDWRESKP